VGFLSHLSIYRFVSNDMALTETPQTELAQNLQVVTQPMLKSLIDDAAMISQNKPANFLNVSTEVPCGQPKPNVFAGPPGRERTAFWANKKYAHG
jgi:hypothetical protein